MDKYRSGKVIYRGPAPLFGALTVFSIDLLVLSILGLL